MNSRHGYSATLVLHNDRLSAGCRQRPGRVAGAGVFTKPRYRFALNHWQSRGFPSVSPDIKFCRGFRSKGFAVKIAKSSLALCQGIHWRWVQGGSRNAQAHNRPLTSYDLRSLEERMGGCTGRRTSADFCADRAEPDSTVRRAGGSRYRSLLSDRAAEAVARARAGPAGRRRTAAGAPLLGIRPDRRLFEAESANAGPLGADSAAMAGAGRSRPGSTRSPAPRGDPSGDASSRDLAVGRLRGDSVGDGPEGELAAGGRRVHGSRSGDPRFPPANAGTTFRDTMCRSVCVNGLLAGACRSRFESTTVPRGVRRENFRPTWLCG